MKLVQIGILVSLVAIAGLLGAIVVMNNQSPEAVQEQATAETLELDIENEPPDAAPRAGPPPRERGPRGDGSAAGRAARRTGSPGQKRAGSLEGIGSP